MIKTLVQSLELQILGNLENLQILFSKESIKAISDTVDFYFSYKNAEKTVFEHKIFHENLKLNYLGSSTFLALVLIKPEIVTDM